MLSAIKFLLVLAALIAAPAAQVGTAAGTISGQVTNMDGSPAADVRVGALTAAETAPGTNQAFMSVSRTDKNGRYRLDGVPPGRYRIVAGALESPSYFPGVAARAEAVVLTVAAGTALDEIDFRLIVVPPLRISGRLISQDGAQPTGNWLSITRRDDPPLVGFSFLDAVLKDLQERTVETDGSFEYRNLRPGVYTVLLSASQPNGVNALREQTVVLEDRDITGLEVLVRPAVVLRQTVTVDDGPLPIFRLTLTDLTVSSAPPVRRSGTWSLEEPVLQGDYQVSVDGLPAGFVVKSMTSAGVDLLHSPLQVRQNGAPPLMAITLGVAAQPPWVRLAGRVTGDGASDVKKLKLTGPLLQRRIITAVGGDGAFQFPPLPRGTYTIEAEPGTEPLPTSLTVNLQRDETGIDIFTRRVRKIPGRVVVEGTALIPRRVGFALECHALQGMSGVATTIWTELQVDGSFVVSLPEKECQISINPGPDLNFTAGSRSREDSLAMLKAIQLSRLVGGLTVTEFRYGTTDLPVAAAPTLFTAGVAAELRITLKNSNTGLVRAKGRLARIDPAITRIFFRGSDGPNRNVEGQAPISADGAFDVNLPAGRYSVTVDLGSPVPPAVLEVGVTIDGKADLILSPPAARNVVIRSAIEGDRRPEGFVFRIDGFKVGRVEIRGNDEATGPSFEFVSLGARVNVAPDASGLFRIRLPEGQYRVSAEALDDLGVGQRVTSITSAGRDLMTNPLIVGDKDVEIEILFEPIPKK